MVIKIVLGTIAYLLCGTATLAVMKWHDRRVERSFDKWLDYEGNTFEDSVVVIAFPAFWVLGLFILMFAILPGLFAKGIMIAATAAVYTIKAIVKGTENGDNYAGDGKGKITKD